MNIKKYIDTRAKQIDMRLDRCLPPAGKNPKIIHRAMRYSVFSGGKRLRPVLAIESAGICGGSLRDIMPTACALELIHAYSLIHDDLPSMDDDDYRRGKPSVHKKFNEAIAILTGDALLSLSFRLMAKGRSPAVQCCVVEEISKAIGTSGMIGGQVMDIRQEKKGPAALRYIHTRKTASLMEASCRAGAIVAGAGRKKTDSLGDFGKFFGLSFQITDDVLDKEGFCTYCGEPEARRLAAVMAGRANDSLKPFGRKADKLKEISLFMLNRK